MNNILILLGLLILIILKINDKINIDNRILFLLCFVVGYLIFIRKSEYLDSTSQDIMYVYNENNMKLPKLELTKGILNITQPNDSFISKISMNANGSERLQKSIDSHQWEIVHDHNQVDGMGSLYIKECYSDNSSSDHKWTCATPLILNPYNGGVTINGNLMVHGEITKNNQLYQVPKEQIQITTVPITTVPITTIPIITAPIITAPITTVPQTIQPNTTAPNTTPPNGSQTIVLNSPTLSPTMTPRLN
jgi:hypothetical protein